jgi:V-type H+-transporting ATPase subunit a
MPLFAAEEDRTGQLGFVTGVISREKMPGFERLLWRACRGNVFLRRVPMDEAMVDPVSGEEMFKEVFIVFFQGEELGSRVRKICEGYDATLYPCPDTAAKRRELSIGVQTRIQDLQNVLGRTEEHRRQVLSSVAFKLGAWIVKVTKIKAIFHTMNKFNIDVTRKCLIAECWYPLNSKGEILDALRRGTERSGTDVPAILNDIQSHEKPPTYFATNKFTAGFQGIVDAYGVASYREVNPSPFTIITFPFLFAVMFGDLGHGTLMAITAFMLILKEKQLASFKGGEIWDTMYGGRYIIFLMGLFSMYTGFIYNDIFSKSITLGGSGWKVPVPSDPDQEEIELVAPGQGSSDFHFPYVFGIDPIWQVADNKLTFTNSYKMKLSVILGVLQMEFGVILGLFNHRFFRDPLRIWHEFIPQVLFLSCIFGYLVIMIIYKWSTAIHEFPNKNPPSLLLMLINMFLQFGQPPADGEVLYGDADGTAQQYVQMLLVLVAVLCVPWMLFVRPCILRFCMKCRAEYELYNEVLAGEDEDEGEHAGGHDEEHSFGEIMVH